MYSIITNKTSAELTLNPNDNYVIQIKSLSEGGLGEGSEPIHIHQLSEFPFISSSAAIDQLLMGIQAVWTAKYFALFASVFQGVTECDLLRNARCSAIRLCHRGATAAYK